MKKLLYLIFSTVLFLFMIVMHCYLYAGMIKNSPIYILTLITRGFPVPDYILDNFYELVPYICLLLADLCILVVLVVKQVKLIILNYTEYEALYKRARASIKTLRKKRLEKTLEKLNKTDTAPD